MAILGAYEEGGLVVIEHSDHPPTHIPWHEAIARCRSVAEAEAQVTAGRREPGVQTAIEQIIAAAREARKKADPDWKPPASVSMYISGSKSEIRQKKRAAAVGLILPG